MLVWRVTQGGGGRREGGGAWKDRGVAAEGVLLEGRVERGWGKDVGTEGGEAGDRVGGGCCRQQGLQGEERRVILGAVGERAYEVVSRVGVCRESAGVQGCNTQLQIVPARHAPYGGCPSAHCVLPTPLHLPTASCVPSSPSPPRRWPLPLCPTGSPSWWQ